MHSCRLSLEMPHQLQLSETHRKAEVDVKTRPNHNYKQNGKLSVRMDAQGEEKQPQSLSNHTTDTSWAPLRRFIYVGKTPYQFGFPTSQGPGPNPRGVMHQGGPHELLAPSSCKKLQGGAAAVTARAALQGVPDIGWVRSH